MNRILAGLHCNSFNEFAAGNFVRSFLMLRLVVRLQRLNDFDLRTTSIFSLFFLSSFFSISVVACRMRSLAHRSNDVDRLFQALGAFLNAHTRRNITSEGFFLQQIVLNAFEQAQSSKMKKWKFIRRQFRRK